MARCCIFRRVSDPTSGMHLPSTVSEELTLVALCRCEGDARSLLGA